MNNPPVVTLSLSNRELKINQETIKGFPSPEDHIDWDGEEIDTLSFEAEFEQWLVDNHERIKLALAKYDEPNKKAEIRDCL